MKPRLLITGTFLLTAWFVQAQGTFVHDQQSTNVIEQYAGLQSDQPMGQSFTPSLSTVAFVEMFLYDGNIFQTLGATVRVNLRSNSITGPLLGATSSVFLPDGFFGVTNFVFAAPANVTPGATYYLEPVIESGSTGVMSFVTDGSYAGGSRIFQGLPIAGQNLWFREGIIVPEPSTMTLLLGGAAVWLVRQRCRGSTRKRQ